MWFLPKVSFLFLNSLVHVFSFSRIIILAMRLACVAVVSDFTLGFKPLFKLRENHLTETFKRRQRFVFFIGHQWLNL